MPHPTLVAPSLLAGNHARLAESAHFVQNAGASWIHLDIMDGHFVPNLTFGPQMLTDLRADGVTLFFDTHLMLSRPDLYIEAFAQGGANLISIHLEPDYPVAETLLRIHQLGCQNGIVLNPKTPASAALPYLDAVDLVLIMTVQPGFGGQSFQAQQLEKIAQIAAWREEKELSFRLEVDGGVNRETGVQCRSSGADTLVAGSAFFGDSNPGDFLNAFA